MNILPIVFTFLLIFSCIAFTFLKDLKSTSAIETSFRGFNLAERNVNNAFAKKAYKNVRGEAIAKKQQSSKETKQPTYLSKREQFPPLESSKFNLGALLQSSGEPKLHPLYETLAELLRLLYKERLFSKTLHSEKLEYLLIDAMLKQAKKIPDAENLAELHPQDPILAKLFYKMLKGTNQYSSNKGIPPLEDFITLNEEKTAASLSFASPFLLQALFGQEVASVILQEENEKWKQSKKYSYFSKDDLQAIVQKNPVLASRFTLLEPYLNFSTKPSEILQIGKRDEKTGIGLEKSIH